MSEQDIYDESTGMLSLDSDHMEAEFKIATRQAVEDMVPEFMFYGYTVETSTAIDVIQAINSKRTYH